ncbi:MAG TPA: UDP-N-acetylglucosamine 1-carboxyvinyltransferase [Deltaproteobacteria bacterium]|nr:UDP-N-acetylglucosamine 1-carboxyvinyltransferase [Deltaproteobacteria bacterium]HCP47026.1 UDP-N-acetylglucosamine 1-carboxyvinyltransferase [Deltaproteobacteria bacterium]
MDKLVIEGGTPLRGEVRISGAKNAALPLLFATLLHEGPSHIANLPRLQDVRTTLNLLIELGVGVRRSDDGTAVLDAANLLSHEAPYDLVRRMRASVLCLGPLLARNGHARVSLPGGCAIGARPIDLHLQGLEALGATIELAGGYVEATAPRGGLVGGRVLFDQVTVGGTENLMMAAATAQGKTTLENCAREPEISDLAMALRSMGAQITGDGTSIIEIEGIPKLGPMKHTVVPDRIEAGTYMAAAAITRGDVKLVGARLEHLDSLISKMAQAGVEVRREGNGLRVRHHGELHAVDVQTRPYPGFPTDLQAQFMALMTVAQGSSTVTESVFEKRFMHVPELNRMGADIQTKDRTAFVRGVESLHGAKVMATDLRASATLVIGGLAAQGRTEVLRVYHLDRGYEAIEEKIGALGGVIRRVPQDWEDD